MHNTTPSCEVIDAPELARRWRVPVSWVRDKTRRRAVDRDPMPHVRLGRYVRFEWKCPELDGWFARQRCCERSDPRLG